MDAREIDDMSVRTSHRDLEGSRRRILLFRLLAAVLASTIALAANIVVLSVASTAGIRPVNGGLFRLSTEVIHRLGTSLRIMDSRSNSWMTVSQPVFHFITGLLMAVLYALVLEPKLPGRPFSKGLAYGTATWCLNAFLVLPLTGEGIAGFRHSNTLGLTVFAIAHMTFFLALSMLFGFLVNSAELSPVRRGD
jgi:uncharacterized membrane protein YagU involved in acid resistance